MLNKKALAEIKAYESRRMEELRKQAEEKKKKQAEENKENN